MAVHVITQLNDPSNPDSDIVVRQQQDAARRRDPSDEYKTVEVEIESGPKDAKNGRRARVGLMLKFPLDGTHVFAVYGDNPAFHSIDRDEWEAAARNAIEKFAGVRGLSITSGPKPENHNRYNMMAEVNKPIEQRAETLAMFEEQRQQMEQRREAEALMKKMGITPAPRNTGPYRPIAG